MQANPYLTFDGRCQEAFAFYEKALGGKIVAMMTFDSAPGTEQTPADWRKKIIHARMTVGDQVLMASDAPPERYHKPQGFFVNLGFDKPADADKVFKTLVEGGQAVMPIQETFWAYRFGMLVDKFGTPWMINCEKAK